MINDMLKEKKTKLKRKEEGRKRTIKNYQQ